MVVGTCCPSTVSEVWDDNGSFVTDFEICGAESECLDEARSGALSGVMVSPVSWLSLVSMVGPVVLDCGIWG